MTKYELVNFTKIDFQLSVAKGMHDVDFPVHTHDFTELTIIRGGKAKHVIEDKEYTIEKGGVMVLLPNISHELKEVDNLKHYNFIFDKDKLIMMDSELKRLEGFQALFVASSSNRRHRQFNHNLSLTEEQLIFVTNLCEMMCKEFDKKNSGYEVTVKSYFISMIAFLSNAYIATEQSYSSADRRIIHTANYIEENYHQKISISQLAQMTYLSERHYTRVFKNIYDMTPIEYIINCRLNHACYMIKNTSLTMEQIGEQCNFTDKSAFSKAFRKAYNISPNQYRKRIF